MASSYEIHQQSSHQNLTPSPDLIQLSDSDTTVKSKPSRKLGYTIMSNEDAEFEASDGEAERISQKSPESTKNHFEDKDTLPQCSDNLQMLSTRRKHSRRRTLTSGSSDQCLSSPNSESENSATPTNLTLEDANRREQQHHWHRLVNDEHCQLLGTEEDSSDKHSSHDDEEENLLMNAQEVYVDPLLASPASILSTSIASTVKCTTNGNGCDVYDHNESVWRISEEQRSYYTQQFRKLQPDLNKLVPGHVAKTFFERSKLSTDHLTKIWYLSDITRDGALSLAEFLVAMHLVVAKRNNIVLPPSLPPPLLDVLLPSTRQKIPPTQELSSRVTVEGSSSGGSLPPLPSSSVTVEKMPEGGDNNASPSKGKEWTKFLDSPTSNVSSPGIKPVNFDFQKNAVEKDPLIYHPVALRLTPDPSKAEENEFDQQSVRLSQGVSECPSPPSLVSDSTSLKQTSSVFHRPLPRKPKDNSSFNSCYSCDSSQYGPTSLPMAPPNAPLSCKKEGPHPPPPPPRGARSHTRSSSLDLNKYNKHGVPYLGAPPAVPPRASPASSNSPPRRQHTEGGEKERREVEEEEERSSAFAIYKKPNNEEKDDISVSDTRLKDKKEVTASIRTTKDKNTRLARLNNELNQELAEVIEERIALELQLEQMKLSTN